MSRFIVSFLLLTQQAFAVGVPNIPGTVTPQLSTNENFIGNSSCYLNKTDNISNNGTGTPVITQITSGGLDTNGYDCQIGASGSGAIWYFQAGRSISNYIPGLNCQASFIYSGNASKWKSYVYDNTNSIKLTSDVQLQNLATGSNEQIMYFPCKSTGTSVYVAFESTASTPGSIDVARVSLGKAVLGTSSPDTQWATWDASAVGSQGFGTLSANSCFWQRVGTNMAGQCKITAGTVAASEARITLPGSNTIDSSPFPSLRLAVGYWVRSNTTATSVKRGTIIANGGNTYINFSNDDYTGTVNPLVAQNGNAIFANSDVISMFFSVPISGWTSLTAIPTLNTNYDWTSITTEPTGTVHGTISSIECSHKRQGADLLYRCKYTQTAAGAATEARWGLPTGLTTAATPVLTSIQGCGTWFLGSASTNPTFGAILCEPSKTYVTFGLQGTNASTTKINASAMSNATDSFEFKVPIAGWSENQNAPQLANSVISQSSGVENIWRGKLANNGTCTITSQSGGLSTCTRSASGVIDLVFNSGIWSAAPACLCTGENATNYVCLVSTTSTTTTVSFKTVNPGVATGDGNVSAYCIGPR